MLQRPKYRHLRLLRPPKGGLHAWLPGLLIACGLLVSMAFLLTGGRAGLSGSQALQSETTLDNLRSLLLGSEFEGEREDGHQDSCHSLPLDDEPFRRAQASTLRSKNPGGKTPWPSQSRGDLPIAFGHRGESPSEGSVPESLFFRPASFPWSGRYPAFLFAALPPPSAA